MHCSSAFAADSMQRFLRSANQYHCQSCFQRTDRSRQVLSWERSTNGYEWRISQARWTRLSLRRELISATLWIDRFQGHARNDPDLCWWSTSLSCFWGRSRAIHLIWMMLDLWLTWCWTWDRYPMGHAWMRISWSAAREARLLDHHLWRSDGSTW